MTKDKAVNDKECPYEKCRGKRASCVNGIWEICAVYQDYKAGQDSMRGENKELRKANARMGRAISKSKDAYLYI